MVKLLYANLFAFGVAIILIELLQDIPNGLLFALGLALTFIGGIAYAESESNNGQDQR